MAKARYKTKQMTELHTFLQSVQGQHVTVQEIREYFKDREIAVGTTTIYRQLEKMVKEIQVAEVNEEEEEKETDQQPDMLQDREQWDLSGDIIDCFRRYSSELSPEEQEEIIKGIEEGMTDQDVKRYFTLVGAEKMRQYRRVLMVAKIRDEDN